MTKLNGWKRAYALLLFCAGAAIGCSAQTFTTVLDFLPPAVAGPSSPFIQGTDGNFYDTMSLGGTHGGGTVFKMTPSGVLTTLYNFCSHVLNRICTDGSAPKGGLVQATNGVFYGTTYLGGANNYGTVFQITSGGKLTTLHSFTLSDGVQSVAGLVQAANGNLYGTTPAGGTNNGGTLFEITPTGAFDVLHNFCSISNCADGDSPSAGLTLGNNGNLYGTTRWGGNASNAGTIFETTVGGKLTTLYDFGGTDGDSPQASLIQGANGNFYGTTAYGGVGNFGTVFEITPRGQLTTLYSFCYTTHCVDGIWPFGALVQATDGNLYGTTMETATGGGGTVFQLTSGGAETPLYTFCTQLGCPDGQWPLAGLLQATNGILYGTTEQGGLYQGTVFSMSMGLGPFVALQRTSGKAGQSGGILGQGFTGTTGVFLNGTPASFTVVSDTYIRATVPLGATSGFVTVNTPSGTLTSNVAFQVSP
jgi:uncharacterized repeat protein (TIGR03803 family)